MRVHLIKRRDILEIDVSGRKERAPLIAEAVINYCCAKELRAFFFFQPRRGSRSPNENRKDSLERCILLRAILGVDRRALSHFLEA